MTDPAPSDPDLRPPPPGAAPTITTMAGYVVTGWGFLPNHPVTIRVTYSADHVSDYLTYATNSRGGLYAKLPVSVGAGTLHITATDHRRQPRQQRELLWSNSVTAPGRVT